MKSIGTMLLTVTLGLFGAGCGGATGGPEPVAPAAATATEETPAQPEGEGHGHGHMHGEGHGEGHDMGHGEGHDGHGEGHMHGKGPHGEGAPAAGHDMGHGEGKHDHAFPPAMKAFHDILAPLWHAEKGAARNTQTCAAVGELKVRADAVAAEAPGKGADVDAIAKSTASLQQALLALETECAAKGANFDKLFHDVHEAFHNVMKARKVM